MRHLILILLIVVQYPVLGIAQLHDAYWIMGNDGSDSEFGLDVDFSGIIPKDEIVEREMFIDVLSSSISDRRGNKLFYTNGCFIYNKNDELIEGSDSLNPGFYYDLYCESRSYPSDKSIFFLESPADTNIYYAFHESRVRMGDSIGVAVSPLYLTLLDKSKTGESGELVCTRKVLLNDTLALGQVAANKHANGRDWWIIVPEFSTPKHFVFLLDPCGIELVREQWIGQINFADYSSGTAVFSPNGKVYARFDPYNNLNIFSFDRCSGTFSNPEYDVYDSSPNPSSLWGSCCFSPNSRFLYVNDYYWVWQYDLSVEDWQSTKTVVAEFDNFGIPFGTYFFKGQLAADGKIYYGLQGNHPYMHVINEPDKKGTDCNLVQRGLNLKLDNWSSVPYFPNYRLGRDVGSLCDSISAPIVCIDDNVRVYPSLFSDKLTVKVEHQNEGEKVYIVIYNSIGQLVQQEEMAPYQAFLDVNTEQFASGTYFYKVYTPNNEIIGKGKLICAKGN